MIVRHLTLLGVLLTALPATALDGLPQNWGGGGYKHEGYEITTDSKEHYEGKPALVIRATPAVLQDGEASAGTSFAADRYRGKRVRFSAYIRTADVKRAALWLAVDGPSDKRLRFDNMKTRQLSGSVAWTRCEIVVDVASEAIAVRLGFYQSGLGTTWMGGPSFEEVGLDVPVTSATASGLPEVPQFDLGKQ